MYTDIENISMRILYDLVNYLVDGSDPSLWIISKFIIASIGGYAYYLAKVNYFSESNETKFNNRRGIIFAFFGSVGGLTLLNPPTAANAFIAGLMGVASILAIVQRQNEGATDMKYEARSLTSKEINNILDDGK